MVADDPSEELPLPPRLHDGGPERPLDDVLRDPVTRESEEILGVDLESTPLVLLAVVGSLAMAAAVFRWPRSMPLLAVVAVAMLVFSALDVREVLHQAEKSRQGLATPGCGGSTTPRARGRPRRFASSPTQGMSHWSDGLADGPREAEVR